MANGHAKIISPTKLGGLRYAIPKIWLDVAGILKGKKVNAVNYQRRMRAGWTKRSKRLADGARV